MLSILYSIRWRNSGHLLRSNKRFTNSAHIAKFSAALCIFYDVLEQSVHSIYDCKVCGKLFKISHNC